MRRSTAWGFTVVAAVGGCQALIDLGDRASRDDADASVTSASDAEADAGAGDANAADASEAAATCPADASFADDRLNCGRCGHDCLGGDCHAGVCAPTTIATGQNGAYWLALDADRVYWTDGKAVRACAKTGCANGTPSVIVDGRSAIHEIAVGAERVLWSECTGTGKPGGVYACPSSGGCQNGQLTTMAAASLCFSAVAIDEKNALLYFGASDSEFVYRCPLDACSFQSDAGIANKQYAYLSSITVAGDLVAWLEASRGLSACTSPGCYPLGFQLIAGTGASSIMPPSFQSGAAYWASYATAKAFEFAPAEIPTITHGLLLRAALDSDGGGADVLFDKGSPTAAVADETGVRFTDFAAGVISYCPLSGCDGGPRQIATAQSGPFALVQDDRAIYWGNYGDGRIMRLAK